MVMALIIMLGLFVLMDEAFLEIVLGPLLAVGGLVLLGTLLL